MEALLLPTEELRVACAKVCPPAGPRRTTGVLPAGRQPAVRQRQGRQREVGQREVGLRCADHITHVDEADGNGDIARLIRIIGRVRMRPRMTIRYSFTRRRWRSSLASVVVTFSTLRSNLADAIYIQIVVDRVSSIKPDGILRISWILTLRDNSARLPKHILCIMWQEEITIALRKDSSLSTGILPVKTKPMKENTATSGQISPRYFTSDNLKKEQ